MDQPFCLKVAERLGILVVSVDYRLAPEYQFPAPTHDVFDVIAHFYKNAELYCIDPLRMGIGDTVPADRYPFRLHCMLRR